MTQETEKPQITPPGFGAPVPAAAERAKRIYVAGPMSGIADYNFPVFNAAAATLRCQGWTVETPAEHSLADNLEWADYMAYDLTRLGLCGAIYLLPGWSRSKGATIEKNLAEALGMNIQFDPNAEQAVDVAPVPHAGVEVLAWRVLGYNFNTEAFALDYSKWAGDIEPVRYLVDRTHVTRLQAESSGWKPMTLAAMNGKDQLRHERDSLKSDLDQMTTFRDNAAKHMRRIREECTAVEKERDALKAEVERLTPFDKELERVIQQNADLQSELTKARELNKQLGTEVIQLLTFLEDDFDNLQLEDSSLPVSTQQWNTVGKLAADTLAHQSAPAAKGGSDE